MKHNSFMSGPSNDNRTLAKMVAAAFGGNPNVRRFWDDHHENHVDILDCKDRPQVGVSSFATLGLSDSPLCLDGAEYAVRAELVGACGNSFSDFDHAMATAAFCVMNSKWFCAPGVVFPDVLSMYSCSPTMKHILFVPPFLWEDELKTMKFETKNVAWLLVVPISEEEREYGIVNGFDALEDLLMGNKIDVFDLRRASVA